ncbi:hypothetical protein BDW59DRAFT_158359 [Aspergillus cavernicola]|uniref:Zn(2)-C6 fungal-type domain-containing protein n=1 Tax=Aspergillus cavernicola TaxID=176166 RepID=A0ABR4IRT6_9EURO
MFGTLHWNSQDQEAKFIERPHGSSNLEKSAACDRCRAKKVKCSASDDGCGRCKRLGKKCTSSSMKHRGGNQRMRKGSINIAQQERLLDLFIQSTTDSTCPKGTRHDELGSSPPADGDIDDGEKEQHRLSDLPPHFDLSFLPEFCQQTGPQDGDDISNLTLSPLPFLSTLLPTTTVLSPPLSSQDEISHYLPPTEPFQHLTSTAFPSHTTPSSQSCQCLPAVIFAIEEVETSCNAGNRAELDSIIAYQKEAIKCCRSMLKCSICLPKRENLVLLGFMAEKLVAASSRIVLLYRMKDNTATISNPNNNNNHSTNNPQPIFQPPIRPPPPLPHLISFEDRRHDFTSTSISTSASSSSSSRLDYDHTPPDWREMLLGDYEISSAVEWEHIVRVLIVLQIRGVMELLADMRNICSEALGEMQTASLAQAEVRVGELKREVYIL